MPTITEGKLTFDFPIGWIAEKYDDWVFHIGSFQNVCGGAKAIDILAVEPASCCWLIEVKDHRTGHQTSAVKLAEVVAQKVRDSLAGLATARVRATGVERLAADGGLDCPDLRVVLHLEQPAATSPLYRSAISRANVLQRLRQLVKPIDPHPLVVDLNGSQNLPWTVT